MRVLELANIRRNALYREIPISLSHSVTTTINLRINTTDNLPINVVWADGSTGIIAGNSTYTTKTYSSSISGVIKILSPYRVKTIYSTTNTFNFDLISIKKYEKIEELSITGNNTINGDISNMPLRLKYAYIIGLNVISGNLSNAPIGMTFTYFGGYNTIKDYNLGRIWANNQDAIVFRQAFGQGFSTLEIDNILIDLSNVTTWVVNKTIDLRGVNAPRSSASNTAVSILVSKGVTVLTN